MQISDPRLWGIRRPGVACVVFVCFMLLFSWGNLRVQKGGILDHDVILQEDDPVRQMDLYVRGKVSEGFDGREFIPVVLKGKGGRSIADLQQILSVTEAAEQTFGDTVMSLAIAPAYQDTGDTLLDEPYITLRELAKNGFALLEWQKKVAADPGVFGLLVGKDFSWSSVIRYLPPGYDEIAEFRKTVEFLEGRPIPWWEWLWKTDIYPQDPALGVGGWTMGRGLIDQGLNVDTFTLILVGVILTWPIFWSALGSSRAAWLCVGVMVLGGFWVTRGLMGWFGISERVFSLLAYASVVVQGTSFALHKFQALKESGEHDLAAGWQKARSVDILIATTAGIAVFGFLSLWTFGLKPIRELGVAAALGVLWILLVAVFFLPALHLVGRKSLAVQQATERRSWTRLCDRVLSWHVQGCLSIVRALSQGKRPWGIVSGIGGVFILVAFLFLQGRVESRTRALEFIRGTLVERTAQVLNQPGHVGFEFLDLLVEPTRGETLYDPHFLHRAWELQTALGQIPGSRETTSILSTVHQIAQASFHKEFPETAEEVEAAFFLVENRLADAVQRQLYFRGGVRLAISYGTDDSVELGHLRERVLALASRDFPDLRVSAFNKAALYPQVDHYVRQGKMTNVFVSQIGIVLICGLLIAWRNRRLAQQWLSPVWGGLAMSLPLFFATAVLGVVMWILKIPLDMATAAIGALTINAATDFSLYLAMSYQRALQSSSAETALDRALEQQGEVIIADCLLNTVCFLPLLASSFLPVRELGWMMGVMLVACAVGALIGMAILLPRCVVKGTTTAAFVAEPAGMVSWARTI
jgi:predicted RND superfamily exporter protein